MLSFARLKTARRIGAMRLWFLGIVGAYALLLALYADLTPFYDGGIYYASVRRLLVEPFRWELLHMEGHPSPVYTLLMAWSQFIDHGAAVPLYATNMALALVAAWSFYRLLEWLTGAATSVHERMIATAMYALMPVFVVHLFHINLDIGLSLFFVPFLSFLLRGKPWPAMAFATAMMLTKETGVLVYLLTAALYLVVYVLRPAGSPAKAWHAARPHWPLLVPPALFGLYYGAYRLFSPHTLGHWGEDTVRGIGLFFDFNLAEGGMLSTLFNLYGLNFNWLLSLVLAAAAGRALWRWCFGLPRERSTATRATDALFLMLTLIGITYVVTRVRPWNNPRYVLVGYPVLIALAHLYLIDLLPARRIRTAFLGITLSLMLVTNAATIDPASRAFYGTIPFGEHAWLDMTSRLGPEWLRRDPQAYNLEFFELHYAAWEAFAAMRPPAGAVVMAGPAADFFFANRLMPDSYRPTLREDGTLPLRLLDVSEDMQPDRLLPLLPPEQRQAWYLAFPNLDNALFLPIMGRHYRLADTQVFGRRGYRLVLYTFDLPEHGEKD